MFPQMNLQYKLVSYFPRISNLTNKSPHMDDSVTGHFVPKLINTQPVTPQTEVDYLPPPPSPRPSWVADSVFLMAGNWLTSGRGVSG